MAKILSERVSMGGYVDFHCCYRQQHYRSVDIRKRAESILLDVVICVDNTRKSVHHRYMVEKKDTHLVCEGEFIL